MKKFIYLIFCVLLFCAYNAFASDKQVPFVIHVHSDWSHGGEHSIEDISKLAKEAGIRAVFLNDTALMKWEYGLKPLQGLIKRKIQYDSVLRKGSAKYLKEIKTVNEKSKDVLIIPGVEAAPYYFWTGNPFKLDLTLNNWHKHMLVSGLSKPKEFNRLPLLGNELNAGKLSFIALWPFVVLILALRMLNRDKAWGQILIIVSVILLVNNFPFKKLAFNQYSGEAGEKPYQNLIDYVNSSVPDTGITVWAHPEAPNYAKPQKTGLISNVTAIYPGSLLHTEAYTGYSYFYEGYRDVGIPGGIWDRLLVEYCEGKRKTPVWAFGELDFKKNGLLGTYIDSIENVYLSSNVEEFSQENLTKGIKSGKFYFRTNRKDGYKLVLDNFEIKKGSNSAVMGETLHTSSNFDISIGISTSDNKKHAVTARIIINGKIVDTIKEKTPFKIKLNKELISKNMFIRAEISADNGTKLVTNPIFGFSGGN